mmetsp:Transcript_13623/g.26301  ORF Transcript_13623/g.26301 Transcript_13623/m.26301 type:complete len:1289 (+) Transcript_13623:159-4025(+)
MGRADGSASLKKASGKKMAKKMAASESDGEDLVDSIVGARKNSMEVQEPEAEANDTPSLLETFWKMSDVEEAVRIEGLRNFAKINSVSDASSEDHEYSVKRLLSGLCSNNGAARMGFVVALTQVLRRAGDVDMAALLKRIEKVTTVNAAMKNNEQKDKYLGRMFAISAVVRSGRVDEEPELLVKIFELLNEVVQWKAWTGEFCMEVISDVVEKVSEKCLVEVLKDTVGKFFPRQHIRKYQASKISALVTIEQRARKSEAVREAMKASPVSLPNFGDDNSAESVELQDLAEVLKDAISFPRLHSAWVKLVDLTISEGEKSVLALWNTCVLQALIDVVDHEPTPQQRYCALQVFVLIANRSIRAGKPTIVQKMLTSETFVNLLARNASVPSSMLHKQALAALSELFSVLKSENVSPAICLAIAEPLRVSGVDTKMIQADLLQVGDADEASKIANLIETANSMIKKEEPVHMVLSQLYSQTSSLTNNNKHLDLVQKVVDFFLSRGFTSSDAFPQLEDQEASYCATSALKLVSALSNQEQLKARKAYISPEMMVSFWKSTPVEQQPGAALSRSLKTLEALETAKNSTFWVDIDDDIVEARKSASNVTSKLIKAAAKTKDLSERQLLTAVAVIINTLNLSSVVFEVSGADDIELEYAELLEDATEAAGRLLANNDEEGEPPIVVLTDMLIAMMAAPSNDLRRCAGAAFRLMVPKVTPAALNVICEALTSSALLEKDEDDEDDGGDDEDAIAAEEEAKDEESEDEDADDLEKTPKSKKRPRAKSAESEKEEEEESSDEDEDEDDEDEKMSDAIPEDIAGLGSMFASGRIIEEDDDEEDEDTEANAKHARATDAALSKFMEAKLAARAQAREDRKSQKAIIKSSLQMKQRLLDLVEIYIQGSGASVHIILVLLPLLQVVKMALTSSTDEAAGLAKRTVAILDMLAARKQQIQIPDEPLHLVSSWVISSLMKEASEEQAEKKDEEEQEGEDEELFAGEVIFNVLAAVSKVIAKKQVPAELRNAAFKSLLFVSRAATDKNVALTGEHIRQSLSKVVESILQSPKKSVTKSDQQNLEGLFRGGLFRWALIDTLCNATKSPKAGANSRLSALQLLDTVVRTSNSDDEKEKLEDKLADIASAVTEALKLGLENSSDKIARELIKVAGNLARKMQKNSSCKSSLKELSKILTELLEKESTKPGLKNLTQNVLRTINPDAVATPSKSAQKKRAREEAAAAAANNKEAEEPALNSSDEKLIEESPKKKAKTPAKAPKTPKTPKADTETKVALRRSTRKSVRKA